MAEDIASFARGLDAQVLWCRTYGHSFDPYTVNVVKAEGAPKAYFEQTLRCRCGVKRRFLLTRTGHVLRSAHRYEDAPGYLVKGLGRIVGDRKDVLRMEVITRLVNDG